MSLDEELEKMDLTNVKKYKSGEMCKAICCGAASIFELTGIAGAIVGSIGGGIAGFAIGYAIDYPEAAIRYSIVGEYVGGATCYIAGWAYTFKKTYNVYKANQRENELKQLSQ